MDTDRCDWIRIKKLSAESYTSTKNKNSPTPTDILKSFKKIKTPWPLDYLTLGEEIGLVSWKKKAYYLAVERQKNCWWIKKGFSCDQNRCKRPDDISHIDCSSVIGEAKQYVEKTNS